MAEETKTCSICGESVSRYSGGVVLGWSTPFKGALTDYKNWQCKAVVICVKCVAAADGRFDKKVEEAGKDGREVFTLKF